VVYSLEEDEGGAAHYMDENCETRPWPVRAYVRNPISTWRGSATTSLSFTTTPPLTFSPHCCLFTRKARLHAMEGTQRTRDALLGKSDVDPISGSESMSLTKHAPGGQELNSFKIVKSAL
jgi:hypothetical protein